MTRKRRGGGGGGVIAIFKLRHTVDLQVEKRNHDRMLQHHEATAGTGVRLKAVGHFMWLGKRRVVTDSGPPRTHRRLSNGIVTVCGKPVLSP